VQGRSTGVAISYNTSVMLFGGLAPFYISLVARFTDARFIPPSYLFGTGVLAIVLVLVTRTGRRMLQADRAERGQRRAARGARMQREATGDRAV
jgi:MHS family proline/betaine transporter-like MFS transporter